MARLTKCIYCEVKSTSEKEKIKINDKDYKYIHSECIAAYEEKRNQIEIGNKLWDDLYQYLLDLHKAIEIPKFSITKLKDFKKDKDISFKLILDAYKYAEEKIKWSLDNVVECRNNASGFNAGMTLMIKHGLNPVYQQEQMRKKKVEEQEKLLRQETTQDMSTHIIINKTYKKDEMDISDLL